MKKTGTILIILFSLLIAFAVTWLEMQADVPEKYLIESYDYQVFKIINQDSTTECYNITNRLAVGDTNSVLLLGLRLHLKYISVEKEHIGDSHEFPNGWEGNVDSIEYFNILLNSKSIIPQVTGMPEFKYFKWVDRQILEHSGARYDCYSASYYQTPVVFMERYNLQESGTVQDFENYHFWKLPDSLKTEVIDHGIEVRLINNNGDTIPRLSDPWTR